MKDFVVFGFMMLLSVVITAQSATIDPTLSVLLEDNQAHDIIVKMKDVSKIIEPNNAFSKEKKGKSVYSQLTKNTKKAQSEIINFFISESLDFRAFKIVNAISLKANKDLVNRLLQRTDVEHISGDPQTALSYMVDEPRAESRMAEPEWGIKMIQADSVWSMGFTGQGTVIAGQDTGYDFQHPSLIKKYRGYAADSNYVHDYNWHDAIHEISVLHGDSTLDASNNPCGLDVLYPCDDNNHGTHTMGTMVGSDEDNSTGVAPDASWMACRNMERGYGSPSTYLECFEWFLAPTDLNNENPMPSQAPHVIANSWGCPEMEGCNPSNWYIMDEAVENLRAAGVVVVVSAGNSGSSCESVNTPAAIYAGSFSVGATASNDTIAGFSSRGPVAVDSSFRLKPEISAPGVGVRSTIRNGGFASFSGTSMAGPHVAGVVGLLISANPSLAGQVALIEEIIKDTAVPKTSDQDCGQYLGADIPNAVYGYGRINALAAIESAMALSSVNNIDEVINVKVFPNPSMDVVNFQIKDQTIDKLVIVDGLGREQYRTTTPIESTKLKIANWPTGAYHYQLWISDQVVTGTLIKQ